MQTCETIQVEAPELPSDENLALTYAELSKEIELARDAATSAKDSWIGLLKVAEQLGLADDPSAAFVGSHKWSLTRVSILGYRGVENPDELVLEFDPRPGITVLHGSNGAGKSSISDAIATALYRTPGGAQGSETGRGGNAQLWEPVHCGRARKEAHVEVTLASGTERLLIGCTIDESNSIAESHARHDAGTGSHEVDLGKAWDEALKSHQPVFAYASLDRQIQLSKNLKDYLETLLALGGRFRALEDEVARLGQGPQEAMQLWIRSLNEAKAEVAKIDSARQRHDETDLSPIDWPLVGDRMETWLQANRLNEKIDESDEITSESVIDLTHTATRLNQTVTELKSAADSAVNKLADDLRALDARVSEIGDAGLQCPVCDATDPNWTATLHKHAVDLEATSAGREAIRLVVGELRTATRTILDPMLAVQIGNSCDSLVANSQSNGKSLRDSFVHAVDQFGETNTSSVVTQPSVLLCEWVLSTPGQDLLKHLVANSQHVAQWRRARTEAVDEFVRASRTSQTEAREAASWQSIKDRIPDLKKRLRDKRSNSLQRRTSNRVGQLLGDAGLSIGDMTLQATKVNLGLLDKAQRPLELGMLSAGQRNAILLAPLLAMTEGGPFNFLVLDDPVHAFDEVRVDRLSRVIGELAQVRRVIVFTHDERLREHLLARDAECDSRAVTRDTNDGSVRVVVREQMWATLLDDATSILTMSSSYPGAQLTTTQTIRGLCRQALDNAIRDLAVRNAIVRHREIAADLAVLDAEKIQKTSQRLDIVGTLCAADPDSAHSVANAKLLCGDYLVLWNRGSHGNTDGSEATKSEIDAARAVCMELVGCA